MFCKYWKELDDEHGYEVEFCRLKFQKCACCGESGQCDFKYEFETAKEIDKEQKDN